MTFIVVFYNNCKSNDKVLIFAFTLSQAFVSWVYSCSVQPRPQGSFASLWDKSPGKVVASSSFLVRSTRIFSEFPESALEPLIGMSLVRLLVSSTRTFFRVCLRQEIEELHLCNITLWWLSNKAWSSKTVFLRKNSSRCFLFPLFAQAVSQSLSFRL